MPRIWFTQYVRPRGTPWPIWMERPLDVWQKAQHIVDKGLRLEVEVLSTGHVSLTVAGKNIDVGIKVVPNHKDDVIAAVDQLIMELDIESALKRDGEAG